MKHTEITLKEAQMIVENYSSLPIEYEKTFYYYDGNCKKWIGIDNETGDCWVEEFNSLEDCISWLNGEFEVE